MRLISLLILFFSYTTLVGQNRDFVFYIKSKVLTQQKISDEEIYRLMNIIEDNPSDENGGVDAVYVLNDINCDTCVRFLIDHIAQCFYISSVRL
ncbi:MAG: hypothetical protein KDC86_08070 [Saprospiraceae bacterium]|nr:hypothetical protein [Saprospiraceae bacterium]